MELQIWSDGYTKGATPKTFTTIKWALISEEENEEVSYWRMRNENVNNKPRGCKENAFLKILKNNELTAVGLNPLHLKMEISEREYLVLKGLSKNGRFSRTWHKVEGMNYDDMIEHLSSHFSAKLMSSS